jgi:hypothetical protein
VRIVAEYRYEPENCIVRYDPMYRGETCSGCGYTVPLVRWFDGSVIYPSPVFPEGQRGFSMMDHEGTERPASFATSSGAESGSGS